MAFTNIKENGLEALIVKWLVEHNDYEQGTNTDYNREYAVDETRLFRFLQDTQLFHESVHVGAERVIVRGLNAQHAHVCHHKKRPP